MKEYHKINTLFKRDEKGKIIEGSWSMEEFWYLRHNTWVFTEKVDGTNIRVHLSPEGVRFGGRTDNAQMTTSIIDLLQKTFSGAHPEQAMTLYGEGYGPKIQSGGKYRPDQGFILFDVMIDGLWLRRDSVEQIAKEFFIETVPIIGHGSLEDAIEWVKSGVRSHWGDFLAEGIVMTPEVPLQTRRGERVIGKIKTRDFK